MTDRFLDFSEFDAGGALDSLAVAVYKTGTIADYPGLPREYRLTLANGTVLTLADLGDNNSTYTLTAYHHHSDGWPVVLVDCIPIYSERPDTPQNARERNKHA